MLVLNAMMIIMIGVEIIMIMVGFERKAKNVEKGKIVTFLSLSTILGSFSLIFIGVWALIDPKLFSP